ncbi:acyl-CoA dehydrogenase family protein [Streptomyces sp. NPDC088746]|uniref:acyl-CoA dehydrogenase family protein n=1 Tax=Streptomyces sp. NPDC088746 TaxID=3365885 RepID=UPI00380575C4
MTVDEHRELRRSVRRFLETASPSAEVRRVMETGAGYDRAVWRRLAGELGLTGLIVPEEYGGAGAGVAELAVVMEEMGRALMCGPYLSGAVLAAAVLLRSGDARACAELLPGIADGSVIATVAVAEGNHDVRDLARVRASARRDGDLHRLYGEKTLVIDGHTAGLLLVAARTEAGLSLFAVDGAADGMLREELPALDPTRKLARIALDGVFARLIGTEGAAGTALEEALDLAAVALAAEQTGGAERCLELSVEYAKTREQFGRPIGAFQAIKHKCADMLLEVQAAKAAVEYAAGLWGQDDAGAERGLAASTARAHCSDAYVHAAGETVQIHGGIGFTWEHDAHLYLRRAKSSALLLGSTSWHLERVAAEIGLAPTPTSPKESVHA